MTNRLEELFIQLAQEDYPLHSRVHPLKIGHQFGIDCYIKREDELGCLISGSKVRKFRSIIKALKNKNCKKAALIGSQHSNHVLGLASLLIENDIEPILFLLDSKQPMLTGNALFTKLFVPEKNIQLIPRDKWPLVEQFANQWLQDNLQYNAYVIPEGGHIADSVLGLITLALDIIENERQLNLEFKDILIDAGSGLTATCLIAAFGLIKCDVNIHVMLAASSPEEFAHTLENVKRELEILANETISDLPTYFLRRPIVAPSFGSTNAKIFQTIAEVAKKEGFLLEPVYTAKHFLLLEELLRKNVLQGPVLFIHSGGLFTLSGYHQNVQHTCRL